MSRFTVGTRPVTLLPTLSWDVNLTTLVSWGVAAIAFYLVVMRQRDTIKDVQKAIEHWKYQILKLDAEHTTLKDMVIGECVKREEFEPIVDRLFARIDQSNRDQLLELRRINDHLIAAAKAESQSRR